MKATHDRVRSVLHYEPGTGIFTWLVRPTNSVHVGDVAGSPSKGYRVIKLDGKNYGAHLLAWFYETGTWPTHEIDHIDGDTLNNRFANLRDEPHNVNMRNIVAPNKNNRSGYRGVRPHYGRWQAIIAVAGRTHCLGSFDTPEEASVAYQTAKAEHHGTETYRGRLS